MHFLFQPAECSVQNKFYLSWTSLPGLAIVSPHSHWPTCEAGRQKWAQTQKWMDKLSTALHKMLAHRGQLQSNQVKSEHLEESLIIWSEICWSLTSVLHLVVVRGIQIHYQHWLDWRRLLCDTLVLSSVQLCSAWDQGGYSALILMWKMSAPGNEAIKEAAHWCDIT